MMIIIIIVVVEVGVGVGVGVVVGVGVWVGIGVGETIIASLYIASTDASRTRGGLSDEEERLASDA